MMKAFYAAQETNLPASRVVLKKGFTLVELAIVMTIIGLLIGGILKGQELLENARMTTGANQIKSYNAAVITFMDIYNALPGDMRNPGNFLPGCTAAPCNTSGDGNGLVGVSVTIAGNENNNFWIHLAKSNLINGVDSNSTWVAGAELAPDAPTPHFPMGGKTGILYVASYSPSAGISLTGHYWYIHGPSNTATSGYPLNHPSIAKYDFKFDDGAPVTGEVIVYDACGIAIAPIRYNMNSSSKCRMMVKTGF